MILMALLTIVLTINHQNINCETTGKIQNSWVEFQAIPNGFGGFTYMPINHPKLVEVKCPNNKLYWVEEPKS